LIVFWFVFVFSFEIDSIALLKLESCKVALRGFPLDDDGMAICNARPATAVNETRDFAGRVSARRGLLRDPDVEKVCDVDFFGGGRLGG
jgi:hypothetical protein